MVVEYCDRLVVVVVFFLVRVFLNWREKGPNAVLNDQVAPELFSVSNRRSNLLHTFKCKDEAEKVFLVFESLKRVFFPSSSPLYCRLLG